MKKVPENLKARIARVTASLEGIVAAAEKKQAAAKKPVAAKVRKRALDEGTGTRVDLLKEIAPVTNALDEKIDAIDSMINGLLAALNRKNLNNVKSIAKNLVKAIEGLDALSQKRLSPLASANAKARKARLDTSLRRGKTVVARAKAALAKV